MQVSDAQGSRMQQAKQLAKRLVEVQAQDRLGLILFEKDAQQLCPATTDQDAFLLALNRTRVNSLSKPGSDLEAALLLAIEKCKQWPMQEKYIILISDGESHIPTNWQHLTTAAKKANVSIITIGVGTKTGGLIYQGENMWGKKQYKTYKGKRVISKLKSENLIDIARLTRGRYYHWKQPLIIRAISQQLKTLNPASGSTSVIVYQEWAFRFIFLGLLLLLLESFLPKIMMRKLS